MAKIKSERLIKKYGTENIRNTKYQTLMTEVLSNNYESMNRAIARQSNDKWKQALRKITTKEKRFVLPDLSDVLPKRSIFVNKSAEKGKFITDTLKDRLTKDLRTTLTEFVTKKGKPAFVRQAGKLAGTINPEVIKDFENSIRNTFATYTKKDSKYGMPKNIHNIAVTEVRDTVNNMKKQYTEKLLQKNPELEAKKRWIHNKSLSKIPRKGHMELNGKMVGFNEFFDMNHYKEIKGIEKFLGIIKCMHPHDNMLPLDEKIGCNCDYDLIITRRVPSE